MDFLEAPSDGFLSDARPARLLLERLRARYPVALHGVGLNLLGHEPLDEAYLDRLCRLADRVDAPFVTDHLAWTRGAGKSHLELLPTPRVPELVELAAERAAHVQRRLGRPFGLEHVSGYVRFRRSSLSEAGFFGRTVRAAGCWAVLDLASAHAAAVNHGFPARDFLDAVEPGRVLELHVSGLGEAAPGQLVDTHDRPVPEAVWALHAEAQRRLGPLPTVLEWDAQVPPLEVALAELRRAREVPG